MSTEIAGLTDDLLEGVRLYVSEYELGSPYIDEEKTSHTLPLVFPGLDHYAMADCHRCLLPPAGFDIGSVAPAQLPFPPDVEYFYGRIGKAWLHWIFSNFRVRLPGVLDNDGSPEEWRRVTPPFHLLRFCELSYRDMHYALRTKNNGESWDVIYTCVGYADQEAAETFPTLHESFTDWLRYLSDNDGYPPLKGLGTTGLYRQYQRRIPDEEAEAALGPLSILLPRPPPIAMEFKPGELEFLQARLERRA